jgi:hypothetical protein
MKTAEEIIHDLGDPHPDTWNGFYYSKDSIIEAMKAYAEQAIDRAAEVAKITVNDGYEDSVDDRYYDNCSNAIVSYCIEPNKQSILKVKQELK